MQLAALGITLGISISSGAFCGWLVSKMSGVDEVFDDKANFDHVEYELDSAMEVIEAKFKEFENGGATMKDKTATVDNGIVEEAVATKQGMN